MKYNVVDSSGWIEYFTDGKNAEIFAPIIENTSSLLVPTIAVHEVFKYILRHANEAVALYQIDYMLQGKLVELSLQISLAAAKYGVTHKLPMADSIIFATASLQQAVIWTQDADFKGLPHVRYIQKKI